MIEYGSPSTTERMWVSNDGLINRKRLKIQSSPTIKLVLKYGESQGIYDIQRKLIKSLEDLKVVYDMTVRNEADSVIQFSYGGDNFDPKKVEKQQFELVKGSDAEFKTRYQWTKKQLSVFDDSVKVNMKVLEKEFKELKKLRKEFRNRDFHLDDVVYQPINIFRIVKQSIRALSIPIDNKSNLQPEYVLEKIEELKKLVRLNCNEEFPYNEINDYNLKLLRTLIQSKLATKVVIFENKLSKEAFDWIVKKITEKFYKALIHPGEAVGPIAAQSLGEPTTQLSVIYDTEVRIKENNKYSEPKIGKLIDNYMNKNKEKVFKTHITEDGKASYILPVPKEWNVKVPGLNYDTQKVEWKRVTEFSKHPPNGKLVRIKTKTGKVVIATLSHSFVTKKNGKVITIRGDQLKIGDIMPVIKN
jgi:hypothetical protein